MAPAASFHLLHHYSDNYTAYSDNSTAHHQSPGFATFNSTAYSDNSTAHHPGFGTWLFLSILTIALLILFLWRLKHPEHFYLGRSGLDTSRPRQESSGYSSQLTVVSRSNHPSVVHAINSNGAWDQAVVAGVSESTRTGGTSTVDERSVVVTPARLNECVIDVLCISEYRAGERLHVGSSGVTIERTICLGEIMDGQIVRFLPEWCPLCRRAV